MKYLAVVLVLFCEKALSNNIEGSIPIYSTAREETKKDEKKEANKGEKESKKDTKEDKTKSIRAKKTSKNKRLYLGRKVFKKTKPTSGNVPSYARRKNFNKSSDSPTIYYLSKGAFLNETGLNIGDVLDIYIDGDLVAYKGSKLPVRAVVLNGKHKGALIFGNAKLDHKTRRLFVSFNQFRERKQTHYLGGEIMDLSGKVGLTGRIKSYFWQHFWADVFSSAVAGYAKSLEERQQTILGSISKVNPENAGKEAIAGAAKRSSEILKEELKNYPEYIKVIGPVSAKIIITKTPNRIKKDTKQF